MREIKFRGKRVDNGEWVFGWYSNQLQGSITTREHFIRVETLYPNGSAYKSYEVDPETVGQYTGLQDRNGKDIYEGDILHVKESLSNFVYNQTNGTFTSNSWENNFKDVVKFSPSGLQLVSYYANQHECEVVGDIYTNPDLLGEVRE